jgi:hypothetical protein
VEANFSRKCFHICFIQHNIINMVIMPFLLQS